MLRAQNGHAVRFGKPVFLRCMFSTDASSETGMGGFLDGDYFAVTWDEIRTMRQKPCYPFTDGQASTIAFLELFAVYWALIRWGRRLEGFAVEIFIDNTAAMWWLRKERAPGSYGVLMREVHLLCIRYDIQLIPTYIRSKDNVLADTLSRQAWAEFRRALAEWRRSLSSIPDYDDWRLSHALFLELQTEVGDFVWDACADEHGSNAHTRGFWSAVNDCRLQRWDGSQIFCNPPFSAILSILRHFLVCKCRTPVATAACFILPVWDESDHMTLIEAMPATFTVIRRWEADSLLFTAPIRQGHGRRSLGPTRWPVIAVYVSLLPMSEAVPWHLCG